MVPHIFVMYHVILTLVFQVPECFTNTFERELKWTFIFRDVVFHGEVASIRNSLWRRANARNVSFETLHSGQFMLSAQLMNYLTSRTNSHTAMKNQFQKSVESTLSWGTNLFSTSTMRCMRTQQTGKPICRPLFMDEYKPGEFYNDARADDPHGRGYNGYTANRLDDQFFLGKDIMVAPIVNPGLFIF